MSIETLTRREADILGCLKIYCDQAKGSPFPEHYLHDELRILQDIWLKSKKLREPVFTFKNMNWQEVNENFRDVNGLFFYSQDVHDIVESLIGKQAVRRDGQNATLLSVVNNGYVTSDESTSAQR